MKSLIATMIIILIGIVVISTMLGIAPNSAGKSLLMIGLPTWFIAVIILVFFGLNRK